jgi:hypothetical protein
MNFSLQGEFFNVFNHVAWNGMDSFAQDTTFGTTTSDLNYGLNTSSANGPRNIEVRGNFQF